MSCFSANSRLWIAGGLVTLGLLFLTYNVVIGIHCPAFSYYPIKAEDPFHLPDSTVKNKVAANVEKAKKTGTSEAMGSIDLPGTAASGKAESTKDGERTKETGTSDLQSRLDSLIKDNLSGPLPRTKCLDMRTFGNGDYNEKGLFGQLPYRVCFDAPFRPAIGNCTVYSFGIAKNWDFDDEFARYGCKVFSFDPTIGLKPHQRTTGVNFFPLGLTGFTSGTSYLSLPDIVTKMNHTEQIIDVLKMDIETYERQVFTNKNTLALLMRQVKQILVEWHFLGPKEATRIPHEYASTVAGFLSCYVEARLTAGFLVVESLLNSKFIGERKQTYFTRIFQ